MASKKNFLRTRVLALDIHLWLQPRSRFSSFVIIHNQSPFRYELGFNWNPKYFIPKSNSPTWKGSLLTIYWNFFPCKFGKETVDFCMLITIPVANCNRSRPSQSLSISLWDPSQRYVPVKIPQLCTYFVIFSSWRSKHHMQA